MSKVCIYTRVSTEEQTMEQQLETCKSYCKIKGWNEVDVFQETQSSMKERPVWQECLRRARNGEYSAIVLFRLDRGWRSSRQFIVDNDSLQCRGVAVISVMEGLDPTTPIGKCMMTVLVALGELERTNISIATKQRLQAKKKQGIQLGRKRGSKDTVVRKTDGYKRRWAERRGSKQLPVITPVALNLRP